MSERKSNRLLTATLMLASLVLGLACSAEERKKEHLSEKQLLAVLDSLTRPGVLSIPKAYSGNGLRFRYVFDPGNAGEIASMGLIFYKAGGTRVRYYMLFLDWSKECPKVEISNGADLYREKGHWESDIPFRVGGLGTMRAFAELPEEYAREKLHVVPANKIKRTCAKFDQGG